MFFVAGPPARMALKATIGRNPRLWKRVRRAHARLVGAPESEVWTPDAAQPGSRAGIRRRPFGVNLAGYLTSEKGTGEAARSAAALLQAAGVPLALNNIIDSWSANVEAPVQQFTNSNPNAFNLVYVNGDQAANFAFHKGKPYFDERYNIGCWNWELTDFPDEWMPRFRYFDEIWVPTTFTRDALARISPVPVTRVPYAVQAPPPSTFDRSHFELPEGDFVFLFMFDYHSVLERKNPLGLIDAFKRAFGPSDNVRLLIKSSHAEKRAVRLIRDAAAGAKIAITDAVVSRDEVNALYRLSDCYVSLHRSEGFGLTPAEAMAIGKPVIATGYGGNMDFMTEENSYLVRYNLIELDRDHTPYQKGWVWADPDLDHAAELMRCVYDDRQRAAAIGTKAAADISRLLGANAVSKAMRDRLLAIAAETGVAVPAADEHSDEAISLRRREAT